MADVMEIDLPAAPPIDYLRWMSFWREIDKVIMRARSEGREVGPLGAIGVGAHARTLASLARDIIDQADQALRNADPAVAPIVRIAVDSDRTASVARVAESMLRRRDLSRMHCEEVGVSPLGDEIAKVRDHAMLRIIETAFHSAAFDELQDPQK